MSDLQYLIKIANGELSSHRLVRVFGRNSNIGTATDPETVWNGSGLYSGWNAVAAQRLSVVSSSALDTAAGTGARTILIEGLDTDYNEISETVSLAGLTPVLTIQSFIRVQRALVLTVGSTGSNQGQLTCNQQVTTANIMFVMPAGENRTHVACFTVPAGYNAFVWNFYFTLIREAGQANFDREATVNYYIREFGVNKPFVSQEPLGVTTGFGGSPDGNVPIFVPEKADIEMRVEIVSHDNSGVAAGFDVILVKKTIT